MQRLNRLLVSNYGSLFLIVGAADTLSASPTLAQVVAQFQEQNSISATVRSNSSTSGLTPAWFSVATTVW